MKIDVYTASEQDLSAIAALEAATFSSPWKPEDFQKMLTDPDRLLLAAFADGVFCGYVGSYTVARESDVTTIAVLPAFRQSGVGRALIGGLCDELCGKSDAIFLEVRESNAAARHLYEGCGFRRIGKRRGYYKAPAEDAILYQKDLTKGRSCTF